MFVELISSEDRSREGTDVGNKITITAGNVRVLVELNDTRSAKSVWEALPFDAEARTWGDEIYFSIPVKMGLENGQEVVDKGDVGYWPPGSAMCLFFGPTPVSRGGEIRPASAVTVLGKIVSDLGQLRQVRDGMHLKVTRAEE
ncbi:MAG TPA: hypothetical protein GX506_08005 [Firmicutes bacterium]|nr:hypothetical protein [Bacillota bacterium]